MPSAHIVLVGLPGVGKSTIGAALSHRLRRAFLDFDVEISRREGKSISEIFAEEGEAAFREYEMQLTRELAGQRGRPMILSPGGGWVTNEGAIELLRPPSVLVHLRATAEFATGRVLRSPKLRPLLNQGDPLEAMERLWNARRELFERADFAVDVEALDIQGVTDRVVELAGQGSSGLG